MIAYMRVDAKEIQIDTAITADVLSTKMKAKVPSEVKKVEMAIASFRPIFCSSTAPTSDPGKLESDISSALRQENGRTYPAIV